MDGSARLYQGATRSVEPTLTAAVGALTLAAATFTLEQGQLCS